MEQVFVIEFGMGIDLHGQDVTKAAVRAVRDAIGHNSLPGMRTVVGGDIARMQVHVRLAVPADADKLDHETVKAALPYGEVTIEVVPGGMIAPGGREPIYVVNACIEVGK